ncbi:hypothetical protein G3R67_003403 [Salmonella enterica subsp. enterica serovar Agona]|nr:hypothetical protein [Salmonella enterica subsp. enterica serovar Agona]EJW5798217.1 hypothetical protein [Salmonella enterica]
MKTLLAVLLGSSMALSLSAEASSCAYIAKDAISQAKAEDVISQPIAVMVCERWKDYAGFDDKSWNEVFRAEIKMAKGNVKLENTLWIIANAAKN